MTATEQRALRMLVCGGRDFTDAERLAALLDRFRIAEICHGGARGADRLAGEYAAARGIPCKVFPANWKRDGRAAGPIRNRWMLDTFQPDVVAAMPGGSGTADMKRIARVAAVRVVEG